MKTDCTDSRMELQAHGRRRVQGAFDGGTVTSDAGGLLLREVELGTPGSWSWISRIVELSLQDRGA
jgi:hypothetical protein